MAAKQVIKKIIALYIYKLYFLAHTNKRLSTAILTVLFTGRKITII